MHTVLQPVRLMLSWHEMEAVGIQHGDGRELCSAEPYLLKSCPGTAFQVIFPLKHAQELSRGVLPGTHSKPFRDSHLNIWMMWPILDVRLDVWSVLVPIFLHWLYRVWKVTCLSLDFLGFRHEESRWRMPFTASLTPSGWGQVSNCSACGIMHYEQSVSQ